METNSNESAMAEPATNMDSSDKMMSNEGEFYEDSAQVPDFDNAENEEGFDQCFQASNRGGFRYIMNSVL